MPLIEREKLAEGISKALMGVKGREKNEARLIEALIAMGTNLFKGMEWNSFNPDQLLIRALVTNPNTLLIESLIHNGANVNQPDKYGRTPLHIALLVEKPSLAGRSAPHQQGRQCKSAG